MRTLIIIVSGLILFGISLLASRWLSAAGTTPALTTKIFIPLWLIAAAYNMLVDHALVIQWRKSCRSFW